MGQRGAELGARMHDAFARLLAGGAERVIMIGADVPHLPSATIDAAFAALAVCDVVLTPTRDGGYCLIGMRRPRDVFSGIAMGTANVLADTLARAATLGLSTRVLDETFDVDELEDLRDLAALIAAGTVELPHTATVLRAVGIRA
jgi:rSAM/selenodomain-associated transferase 1